jgi:hypothetical protein
MPQIFSRYSRKKIIFAVHAQSVRGELAALKADVPGAAPAGENPLLGTWKLQSLVSEVIATGQRSNPFGDHPDGYLSYSPDGRMYSIVVMQNRPNPRDEDRLFSRRRSPINRERARRRDI